MAPAFWNLLWSHLFYLPAVVASAGLPPRGAFCSLADLGIRDDFQRTIQERLVPGTSAMFALTDDANVDRIILLLDRLAFTAVSTNLSLRQMEALRLGSGSTPDGGPR